MSHFSGRSLPQIAPSGVSARFVEQRAANGATRALQREHGVPTEAITVTADPGPDPGEVRGQEAYLGVVKGGAVIVNVSVTDQAMAERVRAVLAAAGGELTEDGFGSPSTGGYGPTTAHGRRSVIGGQPATSSMANQSYQDALGQDDRDETS